jgi:hypothetical protein
LTEAQYYEYITALWLLRNAMINSRRYDEAEAAAKAATMDAVSVDSDCPLSASNSSRTIDDPTLVEAESTAPVGDEPQQPRIVRAFLLPAHSLDPVESIVMPSVVMEEMVDRVVRQCLVESL